MKNMPLFPELNDPEPVSEVIPPPIAPSAVQESLPTEEGKRMTRKQRYMREYHKQLVQERKEKGLCVCCGNEPSRPDGAICQTCADRSDARRKRCNDSGLCPCGREKYLNRKHCKDCIKAFRESSKRRFDGHCRCGSPSPSGRKTCQVCANRAANNLLLLRREVLTAYGGKCACCGETLFEALEMDHMDGGGAEHRRYGVKSRTLYIWLKEQSWPNGFQILCSSCNKAKRQGLECPHQALWQSMLKRVSQYLMTY